MLACHRHAGEVHLNIVSVCVWMCGFGSLTDRLLALTRRSSRLLVFLGFSLWSQLDRTDKQLLGYLHEHREICND